MIASALEALPSFVLSVFLVFGRVGACLMLIPAIGSARVPVQVRLMLCLGASAAVAATIGDFAELRRGIPPLTAVASLVAVETGKGLFIGFMARFFFAMLQFLAERQLTPSASVPWLAPRRTESRCQRWHRLSRLQLLPSSS